MSLISIQTEKTKNSISEEVDDTVLPSEVIYSEILPRLPAKSLMRFRCTSKPWSSLIRQPSFVSAHHNFHSRRSKHSTHLLIEIWNKKAGHQHLVSVEINHNESARPQEIASHLLRTVSPPSSWNLFVAQRTNALVMICDPNPYDASIHILNPTTRESITIPHPLTNRGFFVSYHLGFSPLTNEYKILQVQQSLDFKSIMFKIFTLGSDVTTASSWRSTIEVHGDDLPFPLSKCIFFDRRRVRVCVHGAIHWRYGTVIVAFDVGEERFRMIPLPKDYNNDCVLNCGEIVEVDGCVGLAYAMAGNKMDIMKLWILKDYQNQVWARETIRFPSHWIRVDGYTPHNSMHAGGEVVVLKIGYSPPTSLFTKRGLWVQLYNVKNKSFTACKILLPGLICGENDHKDLLHSLISFDESIATLK